MRDFKIWQDGIGLAELIIIYVTMCFIVLKVLGMVDWSWIKVLLPTAGFIILICIKTIHWAIKYSKGKDYEEQS